MIIVNLSRCCYAVSVAFTRRARVRPRVCVCCNRDYKDRAKGNFTKRCANCNRTSVCALNQQFAIYETDHLGFPFRAKRNVWSDDLRARVHEQIRKWRTCRSTFVVLTWRRTQRAIANPRRRATDCKSYRARRRGHILFSKRATQHLHFSVARNDVSRANFVIRNVLNSPFL